MFEKSQKIKDTFGQEVLNKVYEHYDIKRARNHQSYKPNDVFADIESDKTYVGKLKFLWLKYPNRYEAADTLFEDIEPTEENMRTKDYELIWVNYEAGDEAMAVAEILPKTDKKKIN